MGAEARERLRRLCADGGWSYAVLWRVVEGGGVRHLVWEEGNCEASRASSLSHAHQVGDLEFNRDDVVGAFVEKMKSEVHVVGYGLVGCAALTGKHRWINHNANPGDIYASAGCLEINDHLRSGIQTAVVIPVLPRGVVQLGSMHMIMEDIGFVNCVRCLVSQLQCLPVESMSDNTSNAFHQNLRNVFQQLTRKNGNHRSIKLPSSLCISQPSCSYASEIDEVGILIGGGISSIFNTAITTSSNSIAESQLLKNVLVNGSMVSLSGERQAQYGDNHVSPDLCILAKQQMVPHGIKTENKVMPPVIGSRLSHDFDYNEQLSGIVLGNSINNGSNLDKSAQLCLDSHGYSVGLYSQSYIAMPSIGPGELHESACATGEVALPIGRQQTMAVNDMDMMGPSIFAKIPCSANFSTDKYALIGDPSAHATSSTDIYFMKTTVSGHHHAQDDVSQYLCNNSLEPCSATCSKDMSPRECLAGSNLDHRFKEHQDGAPRQNSLCFTTGRRRGAHVSSSVPMIAESASDMLNMQNSGNDLFDVLGAYARSSTGSLNCIFGNVDTTEAWRSCTDSSCCISQADANPNFDSSVCGTSSDAFLDASLDQLLDAVVSKVALGARDTSTDDVMSRIVRSEADCSFYAKPSEYCQLSISGQLHPGFAVSPSLVEKGPACSSVKSSCSLAETSDYYGDNAYKTHASLWTESDQNKHMDNASLAQFKKVDEMGKLNRKRSKPGESPRPRPKDRQMIQDRVKELREIVPNGAKLSIDALLERTIKHMLFLQSVTKHADKLKEIGEPKIISKEGGLLLKDNFEGGATWAFEVGTQTMICPIIVEDLNPPRQLLVEMLCEERGFFLEIADLIRGLGLTILKGVMEARSDKVWARFAVEANRDITRMDIFLSLVQLLEPRTVSSVPQQGFDSTNMATNLSDS